MHLFNLREPVGVTQTFKSTSISRMMDLADEGFQGDSFPEKQKQHHQSTIRFGRPLKKFGRRIDNRGVKWPTRDDRLQK
jgi:hypothetical protein